MSSYLKNLILMMKGKSEVQELIQHADVTQSGKTTRIELDLDSKTIGEGIRKRRESDD
ncbi:MAG: hypothetical protein JKY56_12400 [Kofleriaceae bacterium]|nr:hypothetical protein [Kofleriaceae bacterium]